MALVVGVLTVLLGAFADNAFADPPEDREGQSQSGGDTQGKSGSNPDGGGVDKPGCESDPRGCQGVSDHDGNNGCGNDADREDDNNGNCGGPEKERQQPTTTTSVANGSVRAAGSPQGSVSDGAPGSAAAASTASASPGFVGAGSRVGAVSADAGTDTRVAARAGGPVAAFAAAPGDGPRVLGQTFTRDEPRAFAFTGGDLLPLIAAGLLAMGVGWLLWRRSVSA